LNGDYIQKTVCFRQRCVVSGRDGMVQKQ
jgi:hypothetical protein